MTVIVSALVSKVVGYLVAPIVRQFSYLSNHQRNFEDFEKEVEKLKLSVDDVQHSVDDAKRNGEEIEEYVQKWLISVNKIMDEAGRLIEDEEKAKNLCFKGLCPNLKTRYQLSKRAVREMKVVAGLQEEGIFNKISYGTALKETALTSNQGCETFESRMFILKDLLDGLVDPNINMIGVYGMAGIGKTVLVKEVARQAQEDKLFDEVAFVRVSSTPNIKKIQGEIADQLGLELCEETESERANTLCDRLRKEKRILIILDDIWTSLNMETVGIPFGSTHRRCKILLTSRHRDDLVIKMHCQNNYCVTVLNEEEAWSLFTKMVGNRIEEPDLRTIAIQVANECGGLPIAIVTVARALRNKSLVEWKDALQELRSSAINFKGLDALVHSSIELSYNYLIDQEVKSVFLLCSLVKHLDDVPIMDLMKYGMGVGLFEGAHTMQERRDRVYGLVHILKDSCLLLDGRTDDRISMHDIVCNVAMSIASRDHHVFMMRNDVPIELPNKDMLKICTAIFLHDSNTGELPEGLEYPQLTSFYMNPKYPFFQIPDNFFAGMTKLRVLVLTKMNLSLLPSSFHLLQNLETLCLDQCVLGDMAIIGNLKRLEILSLLCSDIEQLPREIGQLTGLKLLDLSNCSKLKVIAPNVISSLSRLEELYMGNTHVQWEFESLQELKHLSRLTSLEIHIQDAMILPKGLFSKKLERFKIFIGDEWNWYGKYEKTRTLKLKLPSADYLDESIKQLKGIEDLYLDKVPGINNVLYELCIESFRELKHLHVQNNPHILCIVDPMAWLHCDAFPLLESLFLRNLIHLEKICYGQLTAESFCKLRIIKVRNCDKLKNIFSFSIARGLPRLQTIKVIKCKNVKEIFTVGREDNIDFCEVDEIEFPQLRSLNLKFLPQLTSFYSQVKTLATSQKKHKELTTHTCSSEVILEDVLDTSIPFFNEKVVFPNLETLELCAINTEKIWHNQLATVSSCGQNLTRLIVHGCYKLKYLFTFSVLRKFVQLQHLEICYCTSLEEIVAKERGAETTAMLVFPKVTFLKLWNLSELRTFHPGIHTLEWPSLKRLEVYGCDKVKLFTSEFTCFQENSGEDQLNIPTVQALFLVEKVHNLEELKLCGKEITMICQGKFPKHLFQKLKILEVVDDISENFPIGLLRIFHNLEKLELRRSSYKWIFSRGEVKKHVGTLRQIKYLKLWELSDMKYMSKQDSKLDSVFQNLEMLEVWWCGNLINLVPSSATFENLTTLEVWHCKGLKNLVTSSTAKSMVRLMKLRIDGCKMMTEVISKEGDVTEDEIIFSKLKWLSLECLESLTSFSSDNYSFKFPSLEDLFVIECPQMKTFSHRVLSTPRLQEVRQNWGLDKGFWVGNLNSTIQQLHENKSSFYSSGIGVGEVSSMFKMLDSTSTSGYTSGQDAEKLIRDFNLQNKLMDNNIGWLPNSIVKFSSLVYLDLSENQIVALPPAIGRLVHLEELDLSSNRLSSLPYSIGSLFTLKKLSVETNEIEALPLTIGQCSSLRELRVAYNRLKALPEAVGKIETLEVLSVRYNRIKHLPLTLGSLLSLRELDVSFNELESVPESLCYATKIVKINIQNNFTDLHSLPRSIGNLEMLEELNISGNMIRLLPDSFRFLSKLRHLHVEENPLEVPPRHIAELGAQAVVRYMADLVEKETRQIMRKKKRSFSQISFLTQRRFLERPG